MLFLHGSNDLYGASRVLLGDVRVLTGLGHRVRVVLPGPGPLTEHLVDAGAEVPICPLSVVRRTRPSSILRFPRLPVPVERGEMVVLWTLALAAYLPALLRSSDVLVSVHEVLPGRAGGALGRWGGLGRGRVMVNSAATARWLVGCGVERGKIRVVYPAAPDHRPAPPLPPDGPFRVLLAGRVNGAKGHLEAVDAAEVARRQGLDVRVTLAGTPFPGQEPHLQRLVERIEHVPWATYVGEIADMTEALAAHHALLVGSVRPESFGIVALEAWAAGRRVIAPDEWGAGESARLVDGVLYRPNDIGSMAAALSLVATEPALSQPPRPNAPASSLCTEEGRRRFWREAVAG